jgi:hypothetical protein
MVGQRGDLPLLQFQKKIRTIALPIENHREPRRPWVDGHALSMFLRQTDLGLQPRQYVSAHRLHQTMIDGLVEIAERLTVQRIYPVVHGRAQVEPLPWYIVPRQLGLLAVVYPHVPIDVKRQAASPFGFVLADPLLRQNRVPPRCPALIGAQQGQFLAQRPHLRRPVQSQQVSPLPSRRVPQLLDGADPRQRHQRQQHEHATQPIEAFGQRIEFRAVAQQSHRQQRWQRQQHATSRNIPGRLEDNGRRFQLAHRCRHSLQRPGCAVAHRRGAVDLTAFALVRGPVRGRDQFFLNS